MNPISFSHYFLACPIKNVYICNRYQGRNPEPQMQQLIISHLPKQPRKLLLEQFDLRSIRESQYYGIPTIIHSFAHASGVEHSYMMVGVPVSQARPLGKCIRMATPFFMPLRLCQFPNDNCLLYRIIHLEVAHDTNSAIYHEKTITIIRYAYLCNKHKSSRGVCRIV